MKTEKNYFTLFKFKILKIRILLRIFWFKIEGMEIGSNNIIGKINLDWPNKITIGDNCEIENSVVFKITRPFDVNNNIKIGSNCFIGAASQFNINTKLEIHNNVLIASNCLIVDTGHEYEKSNLIRNQALTMASITIEEDVWIGANSIILQGVNIGKGSVIGAGSLVNKTIPPYEVWAGTPAKYIKSRI
ncbi:MAG: DapH/DapD/GlmU-related protein [Cytophagaceae bacterium]